MTPELKEIMRLQCERVDAAIDRTDVKSTSCCAKGCFACCNEACYASDLEVEYMLDALDERQKAEVAFNLGKWVKAATPLLQAPTPNAFAWRVLGAPCPFLKYGQCSVYDRRPFSCRVWYAYGNPYDCAMPQRKTQKFATGWPLSVVQAAATSMDHVTKLDHVGVLVAEQLLGFNLRSGSTMTIEDLKNGPDAAKTS